MKSNTYIITLILIGGMLLLSGSVSKAGMIPGVRAPQSVKTLPSFELTDLKGQASNLRHHRGKVILLKFWEAYCPYCVGGFKTMETLAKKYKGQLVVLAVSSVSKTPSIRKLINHERLTGIQFYHAPSSEVSALFRVISVPTTYIINKAGLVVGVVDRALDWDSLSVHNFIDQLISETAFGAR